MKNVFDQMPESSAHEIFTELLAAKDVRIERIVSFGLASSEGFWYDQPEHEWVLLMEGSAQLRFDDRLVNLVAGDYVNILAGTRHRVEKTAAKGRTVWLAIFYK